MRENGGRKQSSPKLGETTMVIKKSRRRSRKDRLGSPGKLDLLLSERKKVVRLPRTKVAQVQPYPLIAQ